VRFAAIRRLSLTDYGRKFTLGGIRLNNWLSITEIVIQQQSESLRILNIGKWTWNKKYFHYHRNWHYWARNLLKDFLSKKWAELVTIILNDLAEFPVLKDTSGYSYQISNE
jgi:polyphosphate kinase